MKYIVCYSLLLAALLLSAGTAYGQLNPVYHNMGGRSARALSGPGACQLADGRWQSGKLRLEPSGHLRIQPAEGESNVYQAGELQGFVLKTDTFGVVRNVNTPSQRIAAAFAQKLYRYGQFTAYKFDPRYMGATETFLGLETANPSYAMDLVLQPATGDAVLVPTGRNAFTQTMLRLVGNCPELATQITKGKLGRQHMRQILQTYAHWQQANPQSATN
ncbi:hypothetical protein [Hymenobacter sp. UYP22]|uniref:hypothetical protein n=1 Tax=Hymenobacter sp. UYP22 TaxID=3156348 RepID=UPI003394EDA6